MRKLFLFTSLSVFACLLSSCITRIQHEPKQKLVQSFDCTRNYPADFYFSNGDVKVVPSPIGSYREAEAVPLSRFGYRFSIEHLGRPHLAVVRYPDDKRRFMCMMDGTTYDMTEGDFTGVNQPLTHKMVEIRKIFWPRWKDCSIVFMTWGNGEPAAVSDIRIYELDTLPELPIAKNSDNIPHRAIGIQFEDPCGRTYSIGASSDEEWLDRTVSYMKYSGQNILTYPVIWYHGPLYPSTSEPVGYFETATGKDRKLYARWTSQPVDWVTDLLKRFEKEDLKFNASMTLLRLGSLMKNMNINLESIKSGKETYNNMLYNNCVQSSPNDWTTLYNVFNFEKEAQGKLNGQWAYGEKGGKFPEGPMFNPLHPKVQQAILGVIQEIVNKYGKYPAFNGISLNMWHATIAWFAHLRSGYDDYTINLFEKETGIKIPFGNVDPDRFSKRYEYLTKNHLETWVSWRCEKVKELFMKMRDVVVNARPDLKLTVTMWTETTIRVLGLPNNPSYQIYNRDSWYKIYRDGGFDVNLFRNEPGIEIDYSVCPSRDRDGWGYSGESTPLEKTCSFRDHDFLDKDNLIAVGNSRNSGVYIFDSWVEAWGKHVWFPCDPDDQQAKELAFNTGKPGTVEGICRINSEYPKDSFWWDSQLRITSHFQGGIHYLEPYAHALAELDACRITRGGLYVDTGHDKLIQGFAKAYRTLPEQKFETIGTTTDPVAVRTLVLNGKRYLYIVNREYYPVKVVINFKTSPSQFKDLATSQKLNASRNWEFILGSYELRSVGMSPETEVEDFVATVPAEIVNELTRKAEVATTAADTLQNRKIELPVGETRMLCEIKTALKEGRYAWTRRALNSYPMRKTEQLINAE
jgi:hypothetical protein